MATLYWGGGTGTWDGFTATNWYSDLARTTLAGRAPAADDDVVFDSTSNATAYTVTISNSTTVCRNVTIAGPASGNLTLAGSGTWYVYGNLTLPATGLTRTYVGSIQYWGTGSQTITTNGVTMASGTTFAGTGTYTLQDALNNGTSAISVNAGTFDTNGKNLTCGQITSSTTTTGTLTLGSSTVSLSGGVSPQGPLTINGGTSNITIASAGGSNYFIGRATTFTGGTFYNVTVTAFNNTGEIYGNNTFNNLTLPALGTAVNRNIVLYGNQTINGTLTIAGQSSVNRYFVRSNVTGTTRTLTVGTVATLTDVDFRDITVAGTSSPWSGTRLGDCGGNTSITFPAAKTVYWNGTTGGAWTGDFWATSSGGAVSLANFPLAQDTAVIDDTGYTSGDISGGSGYNIKTLTITKTSGHNIATSLIYYGDLTLAASNSGAGVFNATFAGRVTQNLTSAGNAINTMTLNGYNASVKLADNLTIGVITITSGGLDTNNKSLTVSTNVTVSSTNTGPFSLTLGSSAVSIAGTAGLSLNLSTAPTMTVSAGTSTITLTNASASLGFAGQTLTWYNVIWSTAINFPNIYGSNTFNNLTLTSPTENRIYLVLIYGNQTVNGTLALGGGSSVIQRLGIFSDTLGTQRTLSAATVTGLTDIDFRDINATGSANWTTGTRLGDCGGNSGITFPAPKTVYWNLAGTQDWFATGWATSSGGTPAVNNFPLAQDTAVFDNAGATDTVSINSPWSIGTISAGGRTSAWTLSGINSVNIYGDVTYGSGITANYNNTYNFNGRGTQTFTTAGKSISSSITVNKPSGTFQHGDAYTSTGGIIISGGTYTTQNYNISVSTFSSNATTSRSVTLGSSTLSLSGSGNVFNIGGANLVFSGASSTINLSNSAAKTFIGGGQTFGTVSSTGGTTNPLTITGSNKFNTLTNSARTYLIFTAGTTQEATTFTYSGASGSVVRWYTSIPGQRATIKTASSAVGVNSTNGGNNSGLTFTGTSPDYFYVKDIAYVGLGGTGNFLMFF